MGDCDCALLVYERRSLATRSYIGNLRALGKPVFAFNVERDRFKISGRKKMAE